VFSTLAGERALLDPDALAKGEGLLLERLATASKDIDRQTISPKALLEAEGVTERLEYAQAPL
jgi:hypothetical protein